MIVRSHKLSLWTLLFSVRGSILPAIWRKVLYTVLLSSAVVASHGELYHYKVTLTATPFTLWGLTLAIFLGFRNTVAYQRFWEARTLWSEMLVVSRNLTRQVVSFLPELGAARHRALCEPLIAFGYLLRDQLRNTPPSAVALGFLDEQAKAQVLPRDNRPNALLGLLGQRFMEAARQTSVTDVVRVDIDQQLSRLGYVLGGCERITNTPIPYPYILMLHRIVHVYCFLLPFLLVDTLAWLTPFAVCILAYTFFGLDALGDQIAEPFDTQPNDLPLDALCRSLEISVREILGEPSPPMLLPVKNVLL